MQQEIQIGAFDQPGGLDTETRHDVVSFLHPHLARLVIFQHHFQFEEVTQPFNPVEMDPGSAHQKQGPLFSHSANLAASQGERFPQLVRLVRWRDVVVALLRTLLIRPAVEDELACRRGERPQFEAARFTAKEGIVLGDVDGAIRYLTIAVSSLDLSPDEPMSDPAFQELRTNVRFLQAITQLTPQRPAPSKSQQSEKAQGIEANAGAGTQIKMNGNGTEVRAGDVVIKLPN